MIGVYRTSEEACAALVRLTGQPGFSERSGLFNPLTDDDTSGFYIDEYQLDKDHWTEGFATK